MGTPVLVVRANPDDRYRWTPALKRGPMTAKVTPFVRLGKRVNERLRGVSKRAPVTGC